GTILEGTRRGNALAMKKSPARGRALQSNCSNTSIFRQNRAAKLIAETSARDIKTHVLRRGQGATTAIRAKSGRRVAEVDVLIFRPQYPVVGDHLFNTGPGAPARAVCRRVARCREFNRIDTAAVRQAAQAQRTFDVGERGA